MSREIFPPDTCLACVHGLCTESPIREYDWAGHSRSISLSEIDAPLRSMTQDASVGAYFLDPIQGRSSTAAVVAPLHPSSRCSGLPRHGP